MFVVFRPTRIAFLLVIFLAIPVESNAFDLGTAPPEAIKFIQTHCYDCHQGEGAKAAFDLTAIAEPASKVSSRTNRDPMTSWVQTFDRVSTREMPPPDYSQPLPAEAKEFLATTKRWLVDQQTRETEDFGRVRGRRLTNLQLERSLQDLLGIDIPLAKDFSDEPRTGGFTTVADGQSMSHFQLEQHLHAVDLALEEAFRRAGSFPDEQSKTLEPAKIVRTRADSRTREPEMRKGLAIVWSSRLIFYGRIPATIAPENGWYRFHVTASALKPPSSGGVWCTVRTGRCVSSAPLLNTVGVFEATKEPNEWIFEAWLPKGEMLEIRPGDLTLKSGKFAGGQVGTGEGEPQDLPGVAFHQIVMERFHRGPTNDEIRKLLFGDLKIRDERSRLEKLSKKRDEEARPIELISTDPNEDATERMVAFASHAFRRPVQQADIASYIDEVETQINSGKSLADALRSGYRSLLCSPRFLYLQENLGALDDFAIAARLSYLLWQSTPDDRLMTLATQGKLRDKKVLLSETRRMLEAPRGADFIEQFAEQWLDLRDIDFTEPDPKLYRDFDPIVQHSMLAETRKFLNRMLVEDRSVKELIDSDYTYLNSRLARFYEIDGVESGQMHLVKLKDSDRRGGILTQGSILKITANGTTTSPVIRGVWLGERLLGEHIPPPPQNVPAIEPDIRGATSIRDMLEKHRSDDSCASCHVKIDPPGFALENYDPSGKWRDTYGNSKNKIDPSYVLPDGREFDDVDQFRRLVLSKPEKIATCVAEKLVTFGTGAAPRFADRDEITRLVKASKSNQYGLKTLVEQVIASDMFLNK